MGRRGGITSDHIRCPARHVLGKRAASRKPVRVAPKTGPYAAWIGWTAIRCLVSDHCPVVCAVRNARGPTGFPKHLIAAEECQVYARVPRCLYAGSLCPGPIFVVA